jgi:ADP-glucose pyrophosphorylase
VWDNVVVGARAKVENAIVAQNAIIGEAVTYRWEASQEKDAPLEKESSYRHTQ